MSITNRQAEGAVGLDRRLTRLFRSPNDADLRWHHIGPHHERCCFNLLDLVGYASRTRDDAPPYRVYNVYGWSGLIPVSVSPDNSYKTIPAAKRAARAWVLEWLKRAGDGPIIWTPGESGVHFSARADHLLIANYYYCPAATSRWHKGFRVWFGCTYYEVDFREPKEAKEKIAETWKLWLEVARERLL